MENANNDFIKCLDYLKENFGIINTFAAGKVGITQGKISNIRRGQSSVDAVHVSALLAEFPEQLGPAIKKLGLTAYSTPANEAKERDVIIEGFKEILSRLDKIEEKNDQQRKLLQRQVEEALRKIEDKKD